MITADTGYFKNNTREASALATLEATQTEEEFDDMVQRNRLLHLCKKHKFKNMEKLGMIEQGKEEKIFRPSKEERIAVGKKCAEMLDQNYHTCEIAEKLNIHRQTVGIWARLAGWKPKKGRIKRVDIDEALDLINNKGMKCKEVAEKFRVGVTAIYAALTTNGYKMHKGKYVKKEEL
jgi:hypothetical protein